MSFQVNKNGFGAICIQSRKPGEKSFPGGQFQQLAAASRCASKKTDTMFRKMELPKGAYEYKFIIDGVWQHDPDNDANAQNSMGTLNSVVLVE